jgi:hypothetical protein
MYSAGKTFLGTIEIASAVIRVTWEYDEMKQYPECPRGSCFTQMTKQAPPHPTVMHSRNEALDRKYSQYMNILCTRIHGETERNGVWFPEEGESC